VRILIVTNHFWPENFRINDLAVGFKELGHEITVYTGIPDYPDGRFYSGYGLFRKRVDNYNGIKVIRYPLIPRGKGKAWNLVLNYLSSAIMSSILAPFYCRDRFDIIFVFETSPVTIGLPAIIVKKLQSIPLILWVLDLWPESLSATGAIESPSILSIAKRMVRFIYGHSDRILVSSEGFVESIRAISPESLIEYFPNWVEPEYAEAIKPEPAQALDALPAMPEGFKVMFAGNIGAAQDFETILQAAQKLKAHTDIQWIILGDGRRADWVRAQVKALGLVQQFHLLGRFPAEQMPAFFSLADALLMTLKREPIFALTAPGKLQSYLAAGKPVIAGIDGEGARIVKQAGAGLTCPAENADELAARIMELYRMSSEERTKMGERGRAYCAEHFNRNYLFTKLETLMKDVIETRNG